MASGRRLDNVATKGHKIARDSHWSPAGRSPAGRLTGLRELR
jgi:hypothetical protein